MKPILCALAASFVLGVLCGARLWIVLQLLLLAIAVAVVWRALRLLKPPSRHDLWSR